MLGAAAVKDTYELLRDGIRKILSSLDKKTKSKMNLSLKAYGKNEPKPKINWDNKKEREELLSILVSDVKEVLSHVDINKEDIDNELKDAANLLAKIVAQDIEQDKKNKPKIKKGVAIELSLLLILKCAMVESPHPASLMVTKPILPKMYHQR